MNSRILVFFFFSIGFGTLNAQSYLSFGSSGVQHEDTLHIGDSIHFSFWLINQGSVAINDSVEILCETFDPLGMPISSMSLGDSYNAANLLNVGDSIFITITEIVSFSSYVLGDNIIVIWPASTVPGMADTSFTPIHILSSISTGFELGLSVDDLVVFPNPVNDYLLLSNRLNLPMSAINILNDEGGLLYFNKSTYFGSFPVDLSSFQSGTYFISAAVRGKRIVKKIIVVK
tara:strand:- start:61 stop:753 length:693 start_codon:yes stop_codon:yes gene_type:complete